MPEFRGHHTQLLGRIPGNQGEQALRLMGIRQARLEPLALSVCGHERMVNGRAAASGEKRIDFSAGVAWFGDILNVEGSLMEIGPLSVFDNRRSVSGSSQWGRVCARPGPRLSAVESGTWSIRRGRGNSGLWSVPREAEGRELAMTESSKTKPNRSGVSR